MLTCITYGRRGPEREPKGKVLLRRTKLSGKRTAVAGPLESASTERKSTEGAVLPLRGKDNLSGKRTGAVW